MARKQKSAKALLGELEEAIRIRPGHPTADHINAMQIPDDFEGLYREKISDISMQEKTEILDRIDACLAPFHAEDAAQMLHAYLALRGVVFKSFKFKIVW